jgi:gamma-glutamylcyclotransferase (GGCT)/AIG2-like uncharacterized protein YtfP
MSKINVFVYGSLKQGFHNHGWMEEIGAKYLGKCSTEKIFDMISMYDSYPGLINGEYGIIGELYEIDSMDIYHLDRLEGYPNYYDRQVINVNMDNGVEYKAICYILSDEVQQSNNLDYYLQNQHTDRIDVSNGYKTWTNGK